VVESHFGAAGLGHTKMTCHFAVLHSLEAMYNYRIVMDPINRQPLKMEKEDN
jgi:hypothetical protein